MFDVLRGGRGDKRRRIEMPSNQTTDRWLAALASKRRPEAVRLRLCFRAEPTVCGLEATITAAAFQVIDAAVAREVGPGGEPALD